VGSEFAVARSARMKANWINPKREPRDVAQFREG